uniref:Uncharacterized protein n=1 Tax=Arion vulgaris TaxID=1028688 RepID=A0A0B6ZE22_9EUPU
MSARLKGQQKFVPNILRPIYVSSGLEGQSSHVSKPGRINTDVSSYFSDIKLRQCRLQKPCSLKKKSL